MLIGEGIVKLKGLKNANDKDCLSEGIEPILSYKQSL